MLVGGGHILLTLGVGVAGVGVAGVGVAGVGVAWSAGHRRRQERSVVFVL